MARTKGGKAGAVSGKERRILDDDLIDGDEGYEDGEDTLMKNAFDPDRPDVREDDDHVSDYLKDPKVRAGYGIRWHFP